MSVCQPIILIFDILRKTYTITFPICLEEVEYQSINSDAKLIIDLISLEQLMGEKMKLRDLSF